MFSKIIFVFFCFFIVAFSSPIMQMEAKDIPVLLSSQNLGDGFVLANQPGTTPEELNDEFNLTGTDFELTTIEQNNPKDPSEKRNLCYKTELLNLETGKNIGTGIDCITPVVVVNNVYGKDDTVLLITRTTTIFIFKDGSIVSAANVDAYPVNPSWAVPVFGTLPTHIASSVNTGDVGESGLDPGSGKTIISFAGTGKFKNKTGAVRLSGAIDLSRFSEAESPVGFSCIFVISIDD